MHPRFRQTLAALAGLALASTQAAAQASTGTITGRVTDRTAQNAPLAEAQLQIVSTVRGARTGDDGTYRLASVPPGTYQLRVLRIGYAQQTRSITVQAGQTATADFALETTATQLDQVIVSATGESQRKREKGASTTLIDTTLVNLAAAPNLSSVLTARTAGLTVQQNGGTTGTASRIRLRGSNSINLSNDPLLIVDGVLVNNNITFAAGVGGQSASRFDDINADDIENIEVIKGPSASALYGTAAANGVIQITTKRGRAGRTRWSVTSEAGSLQQVNEFPANYTRMGLNANGSRNGFCTLDGQTQGICTPSQSSAAAVLQRNLAAVGKGRALLNLNRPADAKNAVANVPTSFVYEFQHSENTTRQNNGAFIGVNANRRFGTTNAEGATGLAYRNDADPRVRIDVTGTTTGIDGFTRLYAQLKYGNRSANVRLADGIEARLIEAEADLRSGNAAWLTTLNALRATVSLPPLTAAATQNANVDLLFKERAYWMWLTSHRLGDLRRLIRQYSRGAETVFPSGAFFKGGSYGPDVNFPIPFDELNNPKFTGCLDRNA